MRMFFYGIDNERAKRAGSGATRRSKNGQISEWMKALDLCH